MSEENRDKKIEPITYEELEACAVSQGIVLPDSIKQRWQERELEVKEQELRKEVLDMEEKVALQILQEEALEAEVAEGRERLEELEGRIDKFRQANDFLRQESLLQKKEIKKECSPWFIPLLGNGIVAVALVVAGLWTYHHNFTPKAPVAIDIRGYVEEQKQLFADGKINSEQLRRNMDHLEEVVARISSRQAVFMADAVIKNVEVIKP